MPLTVPIDLGPVARDLQLPLPSVERTIQLLDEGNTVPFVTRYRKDHTGGLDEEQIRYIQQAVEKQRSLAERKRTIHKSIESQGKLTPELETAIVSATSVKQLEDLYLPFKPRKQSLAQTARTRGLEPLADEIFQGAEAVELSARVARFVSPDGPLTSVDEVLAGVRHILAERFSEQAALRSKLRKMLRSSGVLVSTRIAEATARAETKEVESPRAASAPSGEASQSSDAPLPTEDAATAEDEKLVEGTAPAEDEKFGEDTSPAAGEKLGEDMAPGEDTPGEDTPREDTASGDTSPVKDAATADLPKQPLDAPPPEEALRPERKQSQVESPEAPAPGPQAGGVSGHASEFERSDYTTAPEPAAAEQPPADARVAPAEAGGRGSEDSTAAASESDRSQAEREKSEGVGKPPPLAKVVASSEKIKSKSQVSQKKSARQAKKEKKRQKLEAAFRDYYDFRESLTRIPPHRVLAINRGERLKILRVKIEANMDQMLAAACKMIISSEHPHADFLGECVRHALVRLVLPSLEREARRELTDAAEQHAVDVFARNLRSLLLQPPVRNRRVLAIDPGFRSGCKVVALNEFGQVLGHDVIHIIGSPDRLAAQREKLAALIDKHHIQVIAIGNGTACREAEQFAAELISSRPGDGDLAYVIVNEAGASVYSTSTLAREELPDYDAVQRGAISIGRRLLDPLSELVKISPAHIGVGMYQHDVKAKHLRESLDAVVESCVNYVGVDLNSSSPALLRYVSGLNQLTARRIYEYRRQHGPFRNRQQLRDVPGVGESTFVQAAGFLKISDGDNPLDATWIHPESYQATLRILEKLDSNLDQLIPLPRGAAQSNAAGAPSPEQEIQKEIPPDQQESTDVAAPSADASPELPPSDTLRDASQEDTSQEDASQEDASQEDASQEDASQEDASQEDASQEIASQEIASDDPSEFSATAPPAGEPAAAEPPVAEPPVADPPAKEPHSASATAEPEAMAPPAADGSAPASGSSTATESHHRVRVKLAERATQVDKERLSSELGIGQLLLDDILSALTRPNRDPREDFPPPIFRREIMKLEDLQPGMELSGAVLNVVDFGAFVDIGLPDSGLVHISRLADRYIRDPHEVVSVGDTLRVWVVEVDKQRRRVSLTAISPDAERSPRRPEKRREVVREKQERPSRKAVKSAGGKRPERRAKGKRPAGRSGTYKTSSREPVKPITPEMVEGKEPMRSFSDLAQFYEQHEQAPKNDKQEMD